MKKKGNMTKKKKIGILVGILLLLAAAALLLFFGRAGLMGGGSGDEVYMMKVSDLTGTQTAADRFSGVVEAQKTQDYRKDPDRKLEIVFVKEGQTVGIDTPLFRYDVRETEASIASIGLDIEGLNNDIEVLRSGGDTTEIRLQISQKELEIRQKQNELQGLEKLLAQAEVRSEVSGIVKSVNENGGTDQSGRDLPVVSIMQTGEYRVKGTVSEQSIGMLSQGQQVIVRSRVDESVTWKGVISVIETEPESSQNQEMYYYDGGGEKASKYPFYVSLEDTSGLMLGQHVFIEPDYGQSEPGPEGIWLDESFIVYADDGSTFVWAAENGRLKKRIVSLGERNDEMFTIQVVAGLTEDDLIAWPDDTLKEGMKAVSPSEDL